MSVTCPACNKANQTGAACSRCGCDLVQLQRILEAAASLTLQARRSLENHAWSDALAHAERSWDLFHSADAAAMAFVAAGGLGDTSGALQWHARATALASSLEAG